jgi:polyhydroxybutyrate depolymerase
VKLGDQGGSVKSRLALLTALTIGLSTVMATGASAALDHPVRTTGCRQKPPVTPGTTTTQNVVSGGITREYTLHLPANYNPARPYSLVLSFHGHKRTSLYQEQLSEFSTLDTLAVYPQGLIGTDGESAWTGAPYSAAADDVLFTSDLLNTLQKQLCVDPSRIYAAGKSNGGGFVGVLACRMSGRIAAFAPVSGAFYPQGGDCRPTRRAAIIDFHGTADTTIPYTGNPAKGLPSIQDWMTDWSRRDGCLPWPVKYSPKPGVQVQYWLGCSLVHYQIQGAGHVWPSTKPNNDSATPTVINATPVIWNFFQTHRLA